ncbi:MAG: bifunctional [glutamate--ammonia ligase]-adenylyl-L-tyrosine phosphorylase/[glutamate--ammonia-ligase] adenylyltransferase, partial [Betaproteobacteria bacterium]|nr:bifunctional [glutamate--ammonia ligase]-adenylyl-L-tyrosine phosphorylase/[glutamate--ammonia-ligase] adenylyltransferase [Betaproteobacteria bacterium]
MRPRLDDWLATSPVAAWPSLTLPDHDALTQLIDTLCAQRPLGDALRIARQVVLCRLIECDVEAGADVDPVTGVMSDFAELAVQAAARDAVQAQAAQAGMPLRPDGRPAQLLVAGMGKLGAGELNVSSDIDLVMLHDVDGDVGALSHHEWFSRAARRVCQTLNATGDYGFVFRVDTRLRPNGDEGPSVCSLDMLEQYFSVQGRPWERFAWLRARLLGDVPADVVQDWQAVVLPFVYRRYMDFGMIEALRALHAEVRQDARTRAARNPCATRDIKRSRGGIRELEFFVQLLQLVRGGVAPELRERHTRRALARLAQAGIVERSVSQQLDAAYSFLRRLENRIQYLDDAQTHTLPGDDADMERIAASLGLGDAGALLCTLDEHREAVAGAFDSLLTTLGGDKPCTHCGASKTMDFEQALRAALEPVADADAREQLHQRIVAASEHPAVLRLAPAHRERLRRVLHRSLALAGQLRHPRALGDWVDWLAGNAGRTNYLAFFDEHPQAAARLVRLLDACAFAAQVVRRFPGVVDELVAPQATQRFDASAYAAMLRARLEAIEHGYPGDAEPLLDALRRAYQLELFKLVMRDIEQRPPVETMSDDITLLADTTLQVSLDVCWRTFAQRHRAAPQMAVVGYGKLGSKELGYLSDLDLVLIYDDAQPEAGALYTQFAKRWINWLTTHTGAGKLFDIDTRLRPNGNAGLLVTSLEAFDAYQRGRGGNTAWTWEHQALTKARFVAGDARIGAAFERIRRSVLATPRDVSALRDEVLAMRERIRASRPGRAGRFDLKHDSGGLVDAEFAVQLWVLAHAHAVPALMGNTGTIALIGVAVQAGLVSADVAHAAQ